MPSHLGAEQLEEEGQLLELRFVSKLGSERRRKKKKEEREKRKRERKKERRRRDSRRWSRAGRGVDEKRRARETRRTRKSLYGDCFRCRNGNWVWCQGDESPEKIRARR